MRTGEGRDQAGAAGSLPVQTRFWFQLVSELFRTQFVPFKVPETTEATSQQVFCPTTVSAASAVASFLSR